MLIGFSPEQVIPMYIGRTSPWVSKQLKNIELRNNLCTTLPHSFPLGGPDSYREKGA